MHQHKARQELKINCRTGKDGEDGKVPNDWIPLDSHLTIDMF